jgi:hypothetical protein
MVSTNKFGGIASLFKLWHDANTRDSIRCKVLGISTDYRWQGDVHPAKAIGPVTVNLSLREAAAAAEEEAN